MCHAEENINCSLRRSAAGVVSRPKGSDFRACLLFNLAVCNSRAALSCAYIIYKEPLETKSVCCVCFVLILMAKKCALQFSSGCSQNIFLYLRRGNKNCSSAIVSLEKIVLRGLFLQR